MEAIFGLVLRHALSVAGGWAMAKGYVDAETVTGAVGAASTLAAVVWSAVQKKKSGALSPQ